MQLKNCQHKKLVHFVSVCVCVCVCMCLCVRMSMNTYDTQYDDTCRRCMKMQC